MPVQYSYTSTPYGPYGLYTTSVPVQYSYTSTPPMDRTAYIDPQCLYKGSLYLFFYLKLSFLLHTLDLLMKMFIMRCREFVEVLGAVLFQNSVYR